MNIYTIGFTKTSAERFFQRIKAAGVTHVIDVRLRADSQLAGFAKKHDLQFFLRELLGATYSQEPLLAPTSELLDEYKKKRMTWAAYEDAYRDVISRRRVEELLDPTNFDGACLLCSEDLPHKCHRRIAAEYLAEKWSYPVNIRHL